VTLPVPAEPSPAVAEPRAPMPTLEEVRGKGYPAPDAQDPKKVEFVSRLMSETEQDALARFKQATHNILYANGRQHIGWKQSRKSWEDLPLPDGDVRVTMNYIIVILRARLQRLVSSQVNWRGIPTDNSLDAHDRVKLAINFLKGRYQQQDMEAKLRAGLMQAFCTGVCALKSFWNPSIGPLTPATAMLPQQAPAVDEFGNPLSDELGNPLMGETQYVETYVDADGQPVDSPEQAFMYRPGDTDTAPRTVFNLRVNPEATGWTEAEGLRWLLDEEIVPIEQARERFPKIAKQIRPLDVPATSLTYERIARGSVVQKPGLVHAMSPYAGAAKQADTSELSYIREYWEQRSLFFPKGRLIVVVGGAVAYDGPWPQGVFPYAPLVGEPGVLTAYGRSPVNDMLSPQTVINREWTAIVKEMLSSGAGSWVAWGIPGVPDQISREDNAVTQIPPRSILANRPISDIIQRMQPGSVSADRWRMLEQAKASIFDIGGYHEVSRGQVPPGLDSGVAIQLLLEQETAQLKDAVDAVKRSLITWGRHQLAIARWGYGDGFQRWVPVERPDLGFMVESIDGPKLPDPETIGLDIEYFRPQSEAATRGEVKELLSMGMIDPRKGLKIMDLGAGFEQAYASETRHYAKARTENLAMEKGEVVADQQLGCVHVQPDPVTGEPVPAYPCLLPDDDDHLTHIDVHQEIALDPMQPWPLRQTALFHIAEHRMRLQAAMLAEMQMNQPPAEGGEGEPKSAAA
jgi:hypothetical protein